MVAGETRRLHTARVFMSSSDYDVTSLFQQGKYADLVASVVDRANGPKNPLESAMGAAALACVGRLDDAMASLQATRGAPSGAEATARFYLAVAYLRAGNVPRAKQLAVQLVQDSRKSNDPELRFYAWQALACLRFFTGKLSRSAELARHALDAAFRAGSTYARVLATDLRGHAFVQLGRVHAGIELLRRARALAANAGYEGHVAAIEHSLLIYEIRFGFLSVTEADARVAELSSADCQDSYSSRNASIELAQLLAFAGRGSEAWSLLKKVSESFVTEGDRRTRVRFLAAAAIVASLRESRQSAAHYVAEAESELAQMPDRALHVEVLAARAWVAQPEEYEQVVKALLDAYDASGGVARALVHARALLPNAPIPFSTRLVGFEEDRVGALIASIREKEGPLKLLAEGYFGLYPRSQHLEPGRRIHLLSAHSVLLEDRGDLRVIQVSPRLASLLSALQHGERSKEELISEVWGLRTYVPEKHDTVVHTALSRLRSLFAPSGLTIESGTHGYRLGADIEIIGSVSTPEHGSEDDEPLERRSASEFPTTSQLRQERLVALLRDPRSSTDLATELKVSEMTVLRALRALVASGDVVRRGHGRATRYKAN